jgi:hypothetical protein
MIGSGPNARRSGIMPPADMTEYRSSASDTADRSVERDDHTGVLYQASLSSPVTSSCPDMSSRALRVDRRP